MAKLTEEEAAKLEELTAKRDAPDDPPTGGGRSEVLNVTIDLGDEAAVERALKLGWLKPGDIPDDDDADDADDGKGKDKDKPPSRRGYFKEGG